MYLQIYFSAPSPINCELHMGQRPYLCPRAYHTEQVLIKHAWTSINTSYTVDLHKALHQLYHN